MRGKEVIIYLLFSTALRSAMNKLKMMIFYKLSLVN